MITISGLPQPKKKICKKKKGKICAISKIALSKCKSTKIQVKFNNKYIILHAF